MTGAVDCSLQAQILCWAGAGQGMAKRVTDRRDYGQKTISVLPGESVE